MTSRRHGVDQQPVAAVEAEHDDLEKPAVGVEAEAYLTCRVVLVQVTDEQKACSAACTASSGSAPCLRAES